MAKQSTRIRRTFTPQFKKDAVQLVAEGRSVTEVARSLGIARSLLQRWKEQLERDGQHSFPGKGHQTPEAEELHQAKKKIRDLTEERDIRKKVLVYFANDPK